MKESALGANAASNLSSRFLRLRSEFPQLEEKVYGQPFIYLDSAATSLKPKCVVERLHQYYLKEVANIHRGSHYFGDLGTRNYEAVRETVAKFINAKTDEVVFTKGTTEAINLVAQVLADKHLAHKKPAAPKSILFSKMEHHSNIVPWHLLATRQGVGVEVIPLTADHQLDLDWLQRRLRRGDIGLVAVTQVSNVLGLHNPIAEICKMVHRASPESLVLVDGAQAVSSAKVDVSDLGCDFYAFSGHKLFGPNGVGVLFVRDSEISKDFLPYQGGGSMIETVTENESTYLGMPQKFEAGTPAIGEVIGLGAAIHFINEIGLNEIQDFEKGLCRIASELLKEVPGISFFVDPTLSTNVIALKIEGCHFSDLAHLLNQQGIAVRAGHLCCQPLMKHLQVEGLLRVSLSLYNQQSDLEALKIGLIKARGMLL